MQKPCKISCISCFTGFSTSLNSIQGYRTGPVHTGNRTLLQGFYTGQDAEPRLLSRLLSHSGMDFPSQVAVVTQLVFLSRMKVPSGVFSEIFNFGSFSRTYFIDREKLINPVTNSKSSRKQLGKEEFRLFKIRDFHGLAC